MPAFDDFKAINGLAVGVCSVFVRVILKKTGAIIINFKNVLFWTRCLSNLLVRVDETCGPKKLDPFATNAVLPKIVQH